MNLLFTSIMFLLSSLFGCQQPKNYTSLSTGEFESLIKDEHVQRLDVRTPAEYSEDHISKSININVFDSSFASLADSLLKKRLLLLSIVTVGNVVSRQRPSLLKKDTLCMNLMADLLLGNEGGKKEG